MTRIASILALTMALATSTAMPARAQVVGSYPSSLTGQYVQPQVGLGTWNGAQIATGYNGYSGTANYGATNYGTANYGTPSYGSPVYANQGYGNQNYGTGSVSGFGNNGFGTQATSQIGTVTGYTPNGVTTNQYGVNTGYGQNGVQQAKTEDVMTLGRVGSLPSGTSTSTSTKTEKVDVRGTRMEGPARVVDGKTLVIGPYLIVLNGADAPSADQTCTDARGMAWECGRRAMDRLNRLVEGQRVVCIGSSQAQVGVAATCKVGSVDLGRTMVQEGYAMSPRAVASVYATDQGDAQNAKRGMWGGTFKNPWDARSGQ